MFATKLDPNKPEWQIINIKNTGDASHNALIIRMCHSIADGLRISQFFDKWLKFEDGSDAYIEVFQKMKGAKTSNSIPVFKLACNYIMNCFETLAEGLSKPDDKLCYTCPGN